MVDCSTATKTHLIPLFTLLEKRQFRLAEKALLKLINEFVVKHNLKNQSHLSTLSKDLYDNFNRKYLTWIKSKGKNIHKEVFTLHSNNHDNLLLAHCTDVACIDDLMYEFVHLSTEKQKYIDQIKELSFQYQCYSQLLQE